MVNYFLDTNVFLRYLTNDIPEQAQALENLLRNAEEGECKLHTSVLSIAEIVWTLESYYEQEREQIRDLILGILSTQGLVVEQSQLIEQAVQLYVHKGIDFIDAYNGLWMQEKGIKSALTFDTKPSR